MDGFIFLISFLHTCRYLSVNCVKSAASNRAESRLLSALVCYLFRQNSHTLVEVTLNMAPSSFLES